MRTHRVVAALGLLGLLFLHIDFWRVRRPRVYMDWMPEELVYRLVWVALAWLYLLYVCRFVWRPGSRIESVDSEEDLR